jgi:hypothetical protein
MFKISMIVILWCLKIHIFLSKNQRIATIYWMIRIRVKYNMTQQNNRMSNFKLFTHQLWEVALNQVNTSLNFKNSRLKIFWKTLFLATSSTLILNRFLRLMCHHCSLISWFKILVIVWKDGDIYLRGTTICITKYFDLFSSIRKIISGNLLRCK